jgi:uncharacterized protein DUF6677
LSALSPNPAGHSGGTPRRANPNVAALLTWFVPGAGQIYLGRLLPGVAILLLVDGMYWLGLKLSAGMTFEYLDLELRGLFAPALSPELGNLGGFLWQMRIYAFGPGYLRVWPEHIQLGSLLCALSGVLNICFMVQAHFDARAGEHVSSPKGTSRWSPSLLVGLAWLVPGLAHAVQGRKLRALLVSVTLVGLFVLGTALAEGSNLSRERHFYYWSGQFLVGLPAIAAEYLGGEMRVTHDIAYVDAGLVFGCVAGLLNVLAMIDVYAYSESRWLGLPLKSSARASETPALAPQPAGRT